MVVPASPTTERTERLLDTLAELVARGGASSFLAPPVVPGVDAFPEPWRATRGGVAALLRRLAWHAGDARTIVLEDRRLGAPPTERKPATRAAVQRVTPKEIVVRLELIGEDDVAGTLAHEIGVAHAAINRPERADPYRVAEQPVIEIEEEDLERGAVATVYLGLGVLAANAAFQQYSRPGRFNGAYVPHEYDVLQAGAVPMSELAYLVAVQAAVREAGVPNGLAPPQRDEVTAWLAVLAPRAAALRTRLGIGARAAGEASHARPPVVRFADIDVDDDPEPPSRIAFRWRTHRGGVGLVMGAVLGAGVSLAVAAPGAAPWIVVGAASSGHLVGRRVRVPRCSACASVVAADAPACRHCGAALRGDIERLSDRLDAEERLLAGGDDSAPT